MFLDEGGDKGLGQMNSVVTLTTVIAFRIPPALSSLCTGRSFSRRHKRDHNMQLLLNERVGVHRICLIYCTRLHFRCKLFYPDSSWRFHPALMKCRATRSC
jgi:hypothetical protein